MAADLPTHWYPFDLLQAGYMIGLLGTRPDDPVARTVASTLKVRSGNIVRSNAPAPAPGDTMLDLLDVIDAASMALRSYQFGNSAPELAKETADMLDQLHRVARSPGGHSAHAELIDGKVRLTVLGTLDTGPAKAFFPLIEAELDDMHSLELLGTLVVARDKLEREHG